MKKIFTNRVLLLFACAFFFSAGTAWAQSSITDGAFLSTSATTGTISWTSSTGTVIIFAKEGSTAITLGTETKNVGSFYTSAVTDFSLAPGTAYEFDAAATLVYKSTSGSSVNLTNLKPGTSYQFLLINTNGTTTYKADDPFNGSTPPAPPPTGASFTGTCTTTATITWANPTLVGTILVFVKSGSTGITTGTPTAQPSTYTAATNFAAPVLPHYEADGAANCVYKSTSSAVNSVNIDHLTAGTQYQVVVYNVINGTTYAIYSSADVAAAASTLTGPGDAVPGVPTPGNGQVALTWTAPSTCFDGFMVVASETSAVTTVPTGSEGGVSAGGGVFGSGTKINNTPAEYVVFKDFSASPGTSVTVTGLTNCALAYFTIFARNGTTWSAGAQVTATPVSPVNLTTFLPITTSVATNTSLSFTFDQPVSRSATATGSADEGQILVKAGATIIQTIDRSAVSTTPSATFTLTGTPLLAINTTYTVVIGDKVFASACGGDFTNVPPSWTFKTNPGATVTKPGPTICPGPYTALGDIVINESSINNLQAAPGSTVNIILSISAAAGVVFQPSAGSIDISGAPDVASVGTPTINFLTAKFPITFKSGNDVASLDQLKFTGLQVTGDVGATSGDITISSTGGLNVEGISGGDVVGTVHVNTGSSLAPTSANFSSGSGTYCSDPGLDAITVTASGSNLKWYTNSSLTGGVAATSPTFLQLGISHNPPISTTTTLYVTQTVGCESPPLQVPVTVNPSPGVDAGTLSNQCSGTQVTLGGSPTITGPSKPPYHYVWTETSLPTTYTGAALGDTPNPVTSALDNISATNVAYNFKVVVTDANNCTGSSSVAFNVTPLAKPSLTKPATTFFTTKTPSQILASNFKTTTFTGIGVVQINANTYAFDPSQAYDATQNLPQTFHVFFNGVDTVSGCAIKNYDIATMTLSNSTFVNIVGQYCADEFPNAFFLDPGNRNNLALNSSTITEMGAYVDTWNQSYKFGYVYPGGVPEWSFLTLYATGDLVHYGDSIYRAKAATSSAIPSITPAIWATDGLDVNFHNQVIRNLYDGYYGGPLGAPSVVLNSGTTYTLGTNGNYQNCQTCNVIVPAAFVQFDNPLDIRYYLGFYQSNNYYYPGDVVWSGTSFYKALLQNFPVSAVNVPPSNTSYWTPVSSFDVGYAYYNGTSSGFAVYSQYVQINPNPPVSFKILGNNITNTGNTHNICQTDVTGINDLTAALNSDFDPALSNRGRFEISTDNGTTWTRDGASNSAVVNIGTNTGLGTFNSLKAWKLDSTFVVTNASFSYQSGTTYQTGNNVVSGGGLYTSLIDNNQGNTPAGNPSAWQSNTLTVLVRLYYETGQTGSTHGGPPIGGVGDFCFSTSVQQISIHGKPIMDPTTTGFSITLKNYCATDATAIPFTTTILPNKTSIPPTTMVVSGFGIFDKGDGTGTFTPSHAYEQHPANDKQTIPVTAVYTDIFGCSNTATNRSNVVFPIPAASFTYKTSQDPSVVTVDGTTAPKSYTVCYTDPTISFKKVVIPPSFPLAYTTKWSVALDGGSTTTFTNDWDLNPKLFFDNAVTAGAVQPNSVANFKITYTSTDPISCSTITQLLSISISPQLNLSIAGITDLATYCSNSGTKTLTLSNYTSGGSSTLTINSQSTAINPDGTVAYPISLNLGSVNFHYNVTTGTSGISCSNPVDVNITVLPSPVASFVSFPHCVGDNVEYDGVDATTDTPHPAASYLWTFSDTDTTTSTSQNSMHKWNTQGNNFFVDLTLAYPKDVTSGVQCAANNTGASPLSIHQKQVIGPIPSVDFSFSNVCAGDKTNFVAKDANGDITQYQWIFDPSGPVATAIGTYTSTIGPSDPAFSTTSGKYATPSHQFPSTPQTYMVSVVGITDSDVGACRDTTQRAVSILNYLNNTAVSPDLPYDINSTPTGQWVVEDVKNGHTTWTLGSASPVSSIPPQAAWTNIPYTSSDNSYVNSPCMNLSAFKLPAIGFEYFMNVRPQQDGGVVQYSLTVLNGIQKWKTLGSIGSGQNWYNTQGVSGKPGDPFNPNFYGWSDRGDIVWIDVKHALDIDVIPRDSLNKVRFRIAFGSDGGTPDSLGGFAFANVSIVERNRISLIENFTNTNAANASASDGVFDAFASTGASQVVKLEYHPSLPSADNVSKLNPADPDARAAFYGITNTPSLIPGGYLDGTSTSPPGPLPFNTTPTWLTNAYKIRSLDASKLKITIDDSSPGAVKITTKALQDIPTGNLRLYVVAVDTSTFQARKFFPSAAGIILHTPMAKNDSLKNTISPWQVPETQLLATDHIGIIVFVQDLDTKEVYQAFYKSKPGNALTVTTGLEKFDSGIKVYPIPANRDLLVELPKPATDEVKVRLLNGVGQAVEETVLLSGEQRKTLNTQNLVDGVYILQLGQGDGVMRRKVMILHQ